MKNNKGFSLVELIVVVAIMAVLIGILAPAYLSYVEKTRKGTDEDAAEEVRRVVENACAGDLEVYEALSGADTVTLTWVDGAAWNAPTISPDITETTAKQTVLDALQSALGTDEWSAKSKKYAGQSIVVTVSFDSTLSSVNTEVTIQAAAGE